jgi:hypothetical protein
VEIFLGLFVRGGEGALVDPRAECGDLRVGERRLFVGHPRDVVVGAKDALDDDALGGFAATKAGPVSPPVRRNAAVSARRPPFCCEAPWQR